ncbi:hypothetical protein ACHAQH_009691 [Verticillium albo-atrum]
MAVAKDWKDIVALKRQDRDSLITLQWQVQDVDRKIQYNPLALLLKSKVLMSEELSLADFTIDAVGTLSRIASGDISVELVVKTYCKRAAAANSLTNFITEVNFYQAMQRAKKLDQHLRETGSTVGPLHGLPITVKDHMDANSFLVQMLIDAGAVVIAKTNVPQTCLCADSDNIVFGRTLNSYNSSFSVGESSGGKGTAISMGASLLGLGSDGSESLRMPAMANGIVGRRPSGYRLPADGRQVLDPGMVRSTQLGPVATFGFMGRSVRDIRLASKVVADAQPWEKDPFLYSTPWVGTVAPARPSIGIWVPDVPNNLFHLFPPVLRGYLAAQERLRSAGFELVEFLAPDMSEVWDLCQAFVHVQGLAAMTRAVAKEPLTKIAEKTGILGSRWSQGLELEDILELNGKLAILNIQMKQAWNASRWPLDALFWVTSPNPALPIDE